MRVLVIGASGFIGFRIARALERAGHAVRVAGRSPAALAQLFPGRELVIVDLEAAVLPAAWAEAIRGVDGIVNAVGAFGSAGRMGRLQTAAPKALFAAARAAGIAHLVQVSAIGAAPDAAVPFLASKGEADADLLRDRPPGWTVVRPSLVYGRGGASAGLFAALAALPVQPAVASGPVRPIHVDDLAAAIAGLATARTPLPATVEAVGPEETDVNGVVAAHRRWLGLAPARRLPVPGRWLRLAGRLGDRWPGAPVTSAHLRMLTGGATGEPAGLTAATGIAPAPLAEGLAREPAGRGDRLAARLFAARPVARLLLAAIWIGSGLASLVSLGEGYALLAGFGLEGGAATVVITAGALWDILLGAALLAGWRPRAVLWAQLATMAGYTLIATAGMPELWLDPLGRLLKNLGVLGLTLGALALED